MPLPGQPATAMTWPTLNTLPAGWMIGWRDLMMRRASGTHLKKPAV
jgi:hypothetical protein